MAAPEPVLWPPGWPRRSVRGTTTATAPDPPARQPAARLELRTGSPPAYDAAEVEDEDTVELGGHPVAYRRVGHREGEAEVVSEEWTWLLDDVPHVLTGTVRREDYLEVCDLFETVAASVEVELLRAR
jgi:hypothetical protein